VTAVPLAATCRRKGAPAAGDCPAGGRVMASGSVSGAALRIVLLPLSAM
jgi:hypothetical protein